MKTDAAATFEQWHKRISAAKAKRASEDDSVWKPLYDSLCGSLLRGESKHPESTNGVGQFEDILMPLLTGDQRQASVRPTLFRPGEDPPEKVALAEYLGDVATAVAHSIGCYQDQLGRPGELIKAMSNALWSVGVLVFGFEPPRGVESEQPQQQTESAAEESEDDQLFPQIDIDRATAENNERSDAGMVWCRSYSPRRVVIDGQFKDATKARWFAIETYMTVQQAKARWPKFQNEWTKTAASVPDGDQQQGGDEDGAGDGVIGVWHVYAVDPLREFMVPFQASGVSQILDEKPLELGIEGLPLLLLGGKWRDERMYPAPIAERAYGPAKAEGLAVDAQGAALRKAKSLILTRDQQLATAIRKGDDHGVYVTESVEPLENLLRGVEVGVLRAEHLTAEDRARQRLERNTGLSDQTLGRREPGNPTATEAANRQQAITARLQGMLKPARDFEAAMMQRLIAVIFSKIDLLAGYQFLLDDGRMIAIDPNRPMIGELLDYQFSVQVRDRLTDTDLVAQANALVQSLVSLDPYLRQQGHMANLVPVAELIAMRSGLPNPHEIVIPMPPPEDPAAQQQPANDPAQAAAPPQEQQADPAQMLEQLYAALEQIPEGDPAEDEILAQIAQVQQAMAA